jgi:transcriptional regulator with XRE-family HTH domain
MTTDDLRETPEGVVAWRVRYLRTERAMSLDDLAEACKEAGFRFSRDALHRLEKGERRVHLNTVYALAHVFSVSPLVLLMRPDANAAVVVTDTVSAPTAEIYEWTLGQRPAPTRGEVNDTARASARIRLRKYLPYALIPGEQAKLTENQIAGMLRENGKEDQ